MRHVEIKGADATPLTLVAPSIELKHAQPQKRNRLLRAIGATQNLDLNRLSWIGWLLLFSTFLLVMGQAFLQAWLAEQNGWEITVLSRVLALPTLLLAIGFFVAVRRVLGVLGLSVTRKVEDD